MQLFWIEGIELGRLGVGTRPRGGDWLEDDLARAARAGVKVIVSMLAPPELDELSLEREELVARSLGINFIALPVPDYSTPQDEQSYRIACQEVAEQLRQGAAIVAHCRQGIGRSTTFIASVLVLLGSSESAAWEQVQHARGRPVPDTREQREWISRVVGWRR